MNALAQEIMSVLPSLRRFAFALTGSTRSGDRYVEVCLEAVLHDATRLSLRPDVRLELFKLFHGIVSSLDPLLTESPDDVFPGDKMKRRIVELPLEERESFLLAHLTAFPANQIAEILDISTQQVAAHIARAREKLSTRQTAAILVIEDEAITAINLAEIVHHSGHALLGVAATRSEALRLAQRRRPDLILADVRLARGESGVTTAREIAGVHDLPVIYITGHAASLLQQQVKPQFVIAKPFRAEIVEDTITEALGGWMPPPVSAATLRLL